MIRARFWVETVLSGVVGLLAAVTLVWPAWIEAVFGVDPDRRSGGAEWMVVAALFALSVGAGVLARRDRRRPTYVVLAFRRPRHHR